MIQEKTMSGEIRYQLKWKILFTIFLAVCILLCIVIVFRYPKELLSWLLLVGTVPLFCVCIMSFWRYRFAYDSNADMLSFRQGIQKEIRFPVSDITGIYTEQEERYIKGGRIVNEMLCIQVRGEEIRLAYDSDEKSLNFMEVSLNIEKLTAYVNQKNL